MEDNGEADQKTRICTMPNCSWPMKETKVAGIFICKNCDTGDIGGDDDYGER